MPAVARLIGALAAGAALSLAFGVHDEPAATQVMLGRVVASSVPMLIEAVSRLLVWRGARWVVPSARAGAAGQFSSNG